MRSALPTLKLTCGLTVALITFSLVSVAWAGTKYKVLHHFGTSGDGSVPYGPPVLDSKGNLYGVTINGGTSQQCSGYGCGTVFKIVHQSNGSWREKVLHSFAGNSDGALPDGALILDGKGDLYGTVVGDRGTDAHGVFELVPGAAGWSNTILYTDGAGPGLLMDKTGNLFGSIGPGDYFGAGAIGELFPGSDGWNYSQLYSFCGQQKCADGYGPPAPPVWDGKGNMYGTTKDGGIGQPACWTYAGCGVIFKMTPDGDGTWTYHILLRFASYSTDGESPDGGLVIDASGNLYGTTALGGGNNQGTIFKFAFTNGDWKKTILYDFPDCAVGCYPGGGTMASDTAGNLYGAAGGGLADCGGYTCGVVFKLARQKNGKWQYSVLHKFTGADGGFPWTVVFDGKGHLFGTTQAFGKYYSGVAFEITP